MENIWYGKPPLGACIDRSHPLGKDIVCALLFNEGGGNIVSDLAGNCHSGIIQPTCVWMPGRSGQSIWFNATDSYVTMVGSPKPAVVGSDFTVAAWINQEVLTSYRGIFGNSHSAGWWFSTNAGKIALWISYSSAVYSGATTMSLNRWYHVAATYINSTKKISFYLDGKPDGIATSLYNVGDGGRSFVAGKIPTASNYYFGGKIGSIFVWRGALGAPAILQHYNNTYGMIYDPARSWKCQVDFGSGTPPAMIPNYQMFFVL